MARSKPEGLWSIHLCMTCLYTWRSSEPASATDPETYDPRFRISPDDIVDFKEFPVVPSRRVTEF